MSSSEYEGSVPPLGEDIPEEDWDAANDDGATGTEEEDGDAEEFDTEDEDPVQEEARHLCYILLPCTACSIATRACSAQSHTNRSIKIEETPSEASPADIYDRNVFGACTGRLQTQRKRMWRGGSGRG